METAARPITSSKTALLRCSAFTKWQPAADFRTVLDIARLKHPPEMRLLVEHDE